jgi:hypothetical protein
LYLGSVCGRSGGHAGSLGQSTRVGTTGRTARRMGASNPAAATGLGIPSTTTAISRPSLVAPLVCGSRGRVGGFGDRGPERRQRPHQHSHPGDTAADDRLLAADRGHDPANHLNDPAHHGAVVKVPKMVGMRLTSAKAALADRGLRGTVRYQTTNRYQAGTVISQSRRTGAGVLPDSTITLVVAKAPPPPKTTAPPPPPPPTAPPRNCDPSYPDVCLDPNASDYDCAGGSGNGPKYVEGPIQVRPPDPFDLDRDGDGVGCEDG